MQLLVEIDKFLRWWADGLALVVPQRWRDRQQRLKQYLLVHVNEGEISIEHFADGSDRPANRQSISTAEDADRSRAREWFAKSHQLAALPTILRLPFDRILVKRLRYPNAVRDDLANVISFDIDRQTPFSRNDVYFDFDIVSDTDSTEHIEVDLLLIPKKEVEPLESIVHSLGLRLTAIDITGRTFESGVNMLSDRTAQEDDKSPYRLRFALFVLWMVLVALIPGKQILDAETTITQLVEQERAGLAAVRPLNKLREEHARLIDKLSFFDQLQSKHVAALDLLNEVTHLLSDTTWIRRFDLKNDTLILQGESNNAAEIPGVLEASPSFSSPEFSSPVTRNNATGSDRFQIVVAVDASERR